MRDDNRYEYNMDVSRTLAQRGGASMAHMSSPIGQYSQDVHILSSGAITPSYRGSGYPSMGTKGYYTMGPDWADAYGPDSGLDYGLSCPTYQVINNDPVHMGVSYGQWTNARQKSGGQGGSVYVDSDSGYGYSTGPSTSLVHRPAVSMPGDSIPSAYSFSSIAASLPSTTNERLLPTPVSRSLGTSSTNYRAGGVSAGCIPKSGNGSSSSSDTTGQNSPISPIADVTAAAAAAGYANAAYDYVTSGRSSQHQGSSSADTYASVSSAGSETIFGDSDRGAATQGPAVDITGYTYNAVSPADTLTLRRASPVSGLTSRSTADSNSSVGYIGNEGGESTNHASGAYHHSSSTSHGHRPHSHPHHHHHATSHHASPRHGSHHLSQTQHAVTGGTTYVEASSAGSHAGSGVGSTAAAADGHRTSVASRR